MPNNIISCPVKKLYILIFLLFIGFFYGCSHSKTNIKGIIDKGKTETDASDSNKMNEVAMDLVITGSSYQQQFRHAEAILEFMEAYKYDSSASILFSIALNFKKLSKFDLAVDYLLQSLERDSTFVPSLEMLAEIYVDQVRINEALEIYDELYKIEPKRIYKIYKARLNEFYSPEKAIELYKELLSEGEEYEILIRLSNLYDLNNEQEKNIDVLEKLFDFQENNLRVSFTLLDNYFKYQIYERAFSLLSRLDKNLTFDDYSLMVTYLGNLFFADTALKSKDYIPQFYKLVDKRFDSYWRVQILCAYLAERMNDSATTKHYISRALMVADTISDVVIQSSLFMFGSKDYVEAINLLNKYETIHSKDYRFPFYIGLAYYETGDLEKSLDYLYKAKKLDSSNFDIWSQLGIVYDKLKNFDSSDYAYQRALYLKPESPLVNNNYAYSLSERGIKLEEANQMIKIAIYADPANSSYLDTYGWIQFLLGNYETALEYIQKSISIGDASYEVYEHLFEIQFKLENKEEAKKAILKAIELNPKNLDLKKKLLIIE